MSNMALAIFLWIITVAGFVAVKKSKKPILQKVFLLCSFGVGIIAFGLSWDAISEIRKAVENKKYYEKELDAINDSIKAITEADRNRYANMKKIVEEHMKDTQSLVCDPAVSQDNYSTIVSRRIKDSRWFEKIDTIDTKNALIIDSCLYLNCALDTASVSNIVSLADKYGKDVCEYTHLSYIKAGPFTIFDELLQLTSEQLNRESEWFAQQKGNVSFLGECLGYFKELMRSHRYLAMVHLEYLMKPQLGKTINSYTSGFESGYGCSRVDVYDLDNGSLRESFRVFYTNSDKLTRVYKMGGDSGGKEHTKEFLWKNLMNNMKNSVIIELSRRRYTSHRIEK